MDFTKDMKCLNCETTLDRGGMCVSFPEIIHWRSCPKCGLRYCIFKENPKREYSLYSELKTKTK
jgi:hypothetical protein